MSVPDIVGWNERSGTFPAGDEPVIAGRAAQPANSTACAG